MSEEDALYRCGLAYEKLVDDKVEYRINFFTESSFKISYEKNKVSQEIQVQGNTVHDINIIFTPDEFRHLTGLHKFLDMKMKSETTYEKVLKHSGVGESLTFDKVSQSKYFFDDMNEENNGDKEIREPHVAKSDFISRLNALENLYSIIAQARLDKNSALELRTYIWDRNASHSERPHNSDIAANFLIEIEDKNNSQQPFTDFFIVKNDDGTYRGMSIFHPEYSYAKDDVGRKVTEIKTLSVETLQNGKSISTIFADDKIIAQCQERARKHDENVAAQLRNNPNKELKDQIINELRKIRKFIVSHIEKPNIGRRIEYYCEFLSNHIFAELPNQSDIFDESDKEKKDDIVERLQQAKTGNSAISEYVEFEIGMIKLKLEMNKLEQSRKSMHTEFDSYEKQCSNLTELLSSSSKELCQYAIKLLTAQKEICNPEETEWIDMEIDDINRIANQKENSLFGGYHIMQFHSPDENIQMSENFMQSRSIAIPVQNPFTEVLRGLTEGFKEALHNITDKMKETAVKALSKFRNNDTKLPETTPPETENTGKDSNNDAYIIIVDNTGTQGYKDYFTIVPANRLDFDISLAYETELQSEKQDMEQEVSEEKMPVPEQQIEYDDW